jgi:TatD DNase family protein
MQRSAPALFDSHTHLDDARFDADHRAVLERAVAVGVTDIVLAGVTARRWPDIRRTCALRMPGLRMHASYGLHPMFVDEHRVQDLHDLETWLHEASPVAVGECGLDFQVTADPDLQRRYFRHQLGLARETGLPVILHARKAVEEVILTLRREGTVRGVVHSYGGSIEQARQLWDLGLHLGLGGPLTHDRAHKLHRLVAVMPLQQLLLETDAPDQPGAAHRGERNEPAFVTEVLDTVARLRNASRETIAKATRNNALSLFGLDPA